MHGSNHFGIESAGGGYQKEFAVGSCRIDPPAATACNGVGNGVDIGCLSEMPSQQVLRAQRQNRHGRADLPLGCQGIDHSGHRAVASGGDDVAAGTGGEWGGLLFPLSWQPDLAREGLELVT